MKNLFDLRIDAKLANTYADERRLRRRGVRKKRKSPLSKNSSPSTEETLAKRVNEWAIE